jgi:peptidylprolyl isomerase
MRRFLVLLAPAVLVAACSSSDSGATSADQSSSAAISSNEYVSNNCAVAGGAPSNSSVAPTDGTTFSGVTVQLGSTPTVIVAPGLSPATEVQTKTLVAGKGEALQASDTLTFNYCGVGLVSQHQFDSSWANGAPITYSLAQLIPGWSVGMPGMKIGEQRLLILPGNQAYGPNPPSPDILPDESLAFVVELVSIQK